MTRQQDPRPTVAEQIGQMLLKMMFSPLEECRNSSVLVLYSGPHVDHPSGHGHGGLSDARVIREGPTIADVYIDISPFYGMAPATVSGYKTCLRADPPTDYRLHLTGCQYLHHSVSLTSTHARLGWGRFVCGPHLAPARLPIGLLFFIPVACLRNNQ